VKRLNFFHKPYLIALVIMSLDVCVSEVACHGRNHYSVSTWVLSY